MGQGKIILEQAIPFREVIHFTATNTYLMQQASIAQETLAQVWPLMVTVTVTALRSHPSNCEQSLENGFPQAGYQTTS